MEGGDLTTRIVVEREDELGALLRSLEKMQGSLHRTVSTVRSGVDRVADVAGEIAAGNNDLSRRTEQQAASLEQTAASMEELSATVKHNAANTLEASTLTQTVNQTAAQGAAAVQRVVETMNTLKEASGKIADITAIIESIAFQTNILALNAAVEAARAGEQGRGFAVVATEVRALAQRSGTAAREIKDLINRSVSSVLDGAGQAADAGDQMNRTLAALHRVTTLIDEIASASQEQSRGIEQVTTAVSHMDEVTQQNASLVEQAASASASMEAEAARMRNVVAGFRTAR
jgi:methyl-accepting chemotaxis protein-1 (serine sensor receptor)